MLLNSTLILLVIAVLTSSYANDDLKKSLVILLDVTASMRDNIHFICKEAADLLDNVHNWDGNTIANYILLQFGDDINNRPSSRQSIHTDHTNIKQELNKVQINRYNKDSSCSASCFRGLENALKLARNDSIFLVFTDGGTYHKELLPELKNLAQQKRISFYFTLTKGCRGTNPADDYRDLISVFNGDIYNVDQYTATKHFELLAQIITGPPFAPSVEVFIDSTISEFTITVTGRNSIITIFDPNEKYVSSLKYKILTDLPNIKMINVPVPIPGRYTIEIVSESTYTGQVQTTSDLQFKYGFSLHEPSTIAETSYAPIVGYNTYLAIKPSNASYIQTLNHVILSTNQNRNNQYKLYKKVTNDGDLYVTESFPILLESFKINVHGRDRLQHYIKRLISPEIQAIPAECQYVEVNANLTVIAGEPINLFCRLHSSIIATLSWSKVGLNTKLMVLESKQDDFLNYTINKSLASDSGEYICTGKNILGVFESKVFVNVKHMTRLHVRTPIKTVNTRVGTERIELHCQISQLLIFVKVTWLFNGKPELPENSQYILPNLVLTNVTRNFNGTYTCIGQNGEDEMRDHIHLNVMYPPTIRDLFNVVSKTSIDTTQPLEIDRKVPLIIDCLYDGNPTPSIQWTNQFGNIVSNTTQLSLSVNNSYQIDEYSCEVRNDLGRDKRKILIAPEPVKLDRSTTMRNPTEKNIAVIATTSYPRIEQSTGKPISKPMVLQNYDKNHELVEGTSFTMDCPIETGQYNVTWTLNRKNIDHLKLSNGSIYFDTVHANMTGAVICEASNKAGSTNVSISLNILRPPYELLVKMSSNGKPLINNRFEANCSANGLPYPNYYWLKNDDFVSSGSKMTIERFRPSDNGNYSCVAQNKLGSIKKTFELQVFDQTQILNPVNAIRTVTTTTIYENLIVQPITPKPVFKPIVLQNYNKNHELVEGTSFTMDCPIETGQYNVTWTLNRKNIDHLKLSNGSIYFDTVHANMTGAVICAASNKTGSTNVSINLNILRPPYELLVKMSSNGKPLINNRFEANCSANGLPYPNYYWLKNDDFVSSGSKMTIERFQPSDNGNYSCVAQNKLGSINKTVELQVFDQSQILNPVNTIRRVTTTTIYENLIVQPITPKPVLKPIVLQNYNKNHELVEGTSFTMDCPIETGQSNVTWTLNGKNIDHLKLSNGSIYFDTVHANMTGAAICETSNKAGSTNVSINLHILRPPYELLVQMSSDGKPLINNRFEANCSANGLPYPNYYWLKNDDFVSSGSKMTIERFQPSDNGNYSCVAQNKLGSINKTVELQVFDQPQILNPVNTIRRVTTTTSYENLIVQPITPKPVFKPIVLQNYNKNHELVEGTSFTMDCPIETGQYNVTWTLNRKNIDHLKLSNGSIYFDTVHANMTGAVSCEASNKAGSTIVSINLNILRPPYELLVKMSSNGKPLINNRFEANCSANGIPEPNYYWLKNDDFVSSGSKMIVERFQPSDNGNYTCVAFNNFGTINKTFIIEGSLLSHFSTIGSNYEKTQHPYDIQVVTSTDQTLTVNDRYELKCSAKGYPQPYLQWMKNNSFLKYGKVIVFEKIQTSDVGNYTCVARNRVGTVKKTLEVQVFDKTKIFYRETTATPTHKYKTSSTTVSPLGLGHNISRPPYEIYVEISPSKPVINDRCEIKCHAKGFPSPDSYWLMNGEYFFTGNTITFPKLSKRNEGNYTCIAENHLGRINKTHILRILAQPKFVDLTYFDWSLKISKVDTPMISQFISVQRDYAKRTIKKVIEVNENERFIMNCTMSGKPKPKITWFKNNILRKFKNSVVGYKNAKMMNSGVYKCIGTNELGKTEATFYVNVLKPVSITSLVSTRQYVYPGASLRIHCTAEGNPLPTIRINYKDVSTGTNQVFGQTYEYKNKMKLFEKDNLIFIDKYKIISKNTKSSLDRYSILHYNNYIATLSYTIKSMSDKDAGTYSCTSTQLNKTVVKTITLQ